MENEKNIEQLIIDYIDGRLSASERAAVKQRISSHEKYKQLEQEYRRLFTAMEQDDVTQPSAKLRDTFQTMLIQEESSSISTQANATSKTLQVSFSALYRVAAMLTLMIGSYWLGNYQTEKDYLISIAELETQKQELKAIAALSLMESNSASKRIQAATYSEELNLSAANTEIIDALIHMMNNDHQINVRLAAATALSKHVDNQTVRDALILLLEEEKNPSMQLELIQILSTILDDRITPNLKRIQEDENTSPTIKKAIIEYTENRQS